MFTALHRTCEITAAAAAAAAAQVLGMRRSLLNAVADQAFYKLNQPSLCTLLAHCNSHSAVSAYLLAWQPQQQCTREVRTRAQSGLRNRANKQPAATAAHSDDEYDSDAEWQQLPRPRLLQRSSMVRDRQWQQQQQQQQSRPGSATRNRDVWRQDLPHKLPSAQQSALPHDLKPAKRQGSTARGWHNPYMQPQEEQHQHRRQQHIRSSSGRLSNSDGDGGSKRNASPSSWRNTSKHSVGAAAAVAGAGAVWHGMLQETTTTSSSSSRVPARQGRDSSSSRHSSSAAVLQSTNSPGIPPALLTKAISSTTDLQQLQQLLTKHKDSLQQINICAAFKAVVRLSPASAHAQSSSSSGTAGGASLAVMRQLTSRMLEQIRVARPWDLAQAAWACSKLQYRDTRLLDSIAQQVQIKSPILLPQDISQIASAYARLGYKHAQLMQLLQQQAIRQAAAFKPWSLIHTAWALQVSGTNPKPLLHVLTQQLQSDQLAELQPLDVATLLWLMAAHAVRDVTLLTAVQKQLSADITSYPPAAAAQALISLAGLSVNDQQLAQKAAEVVLQDLQQQQQWDFTGQQQQQCTSPGRHYSPKHVTHATFALVQFGQGSQALLDAAAAAFMSNPSGFSPGLLCMLCWAFPLAGRAPAENFTVNLVEQCLLQLKKFTADQLASILRGMLVLGGPHTNGTAAPQLIAAACTQLPQQLPHMTTPVLAKLITTLSKQCRDRSATGFTVEGSTAEGGSQTPSSVQQQQEQEQERQRQLLVLLQHCGEEWLQQRRVGVVDAQQQQQQHRSVQKALRMAGLAELAAAAAAAANEHHGGVLAAQASSQQQQQQTGLHAAADDANTAAVGDDESLHAAPGGDEPGSWLDSFVAAADDHNSSKITSQ